MVWQIAMIVFAIVSNGMNVKDLCIDENELLQHYFPTSNKAVSTYADIKMFTYKPPKLKISALINSKYGPEHVMKAIKKNDHKKVQQILMDLESQDVQYACDVLLQKDKEMNENTPLHEARDEIMLNLIFQTLIKDEFSLTQAIHQINWKNETPFLTIIEKNNPMMVLNFLNVIKTKKKNSDILKYITHNCGHSTAILLSSKHEDFTIMEILLQAICVHSQDPILTIQEQLLETNYEGKSILLTALNKEAMTIYVTNIFLKINQPKNLMDLYKKKDYQKNTILNVLSYQGLYGLWIQILDLCKNHMCKTQLFEFLMLLDQNGGTILHDIALKYNIYPHEKLILLEKIFSMFDIKNKMEKGNLIEILTQLDGDGNLAVDYLIQQQVDEKHNFYTKFIWKYIQFLSYSKNAFFYAFYIKEFVENQNYFYDEKLETTNALKNVISQIEKVNVLKVLNYIGKKLNLQIDSINRFKI